MKKEGGQILILALIVVTLVTINTVLLLSNSVTFTSSSKQSVNSITALNLAEAGIDKAVASLNSSGGTYNGESEKTLGDGTYTVGITNKDSSTKIITATGYVPNKTNPKSSRTVTIEVAKGDGLSFSYGIQSGDGGFVLTGGSQVNGSVFANNDITLSGGSRITGDAYVAGGTQATANQETECTGVNCADYQFNKIVSSQNRMDVAQSFRPSTTAVINKVELKLKKVGSPAQNPDVKILGDSSGSPNKNQVLATGVLAANLVTSSYGFVEVSFSNPPQLTSGTTYWIVVDTCGTGTSCNTADSWMWSLDTLQSYNNGAAKWSPRWDANGTPSWTAITGDLAFKTYMGGVTTEIAGTGSGYVNGSAYANTLSGDNPSALQIGGHAYYQTQSGITVHGSSCTSNSYCHPNSADPPRRALPISDSNIQEWKDTADDQVQTGNLTIQWPCTTNLEKKKYVGNVTVQGGCTITADSPVWITGNLIVQGGSTVKLKPEFGSGSGVIVVDGTVNLTGGSRLQGTGTTGSYLMVLSTYSHPTTPAIIVNGGNSSSIVYAANGIVSLQGGVNIREATGYKITMDSGSVVTYETGVESPFFASGPSGSYTVIKGTYQEK